MSEQNKSSENPTAIMEEDLEQVTGGAKYKPDGEMTGFMLHDYCSQCPKGDRYRRVICSDCPYC